MVTIKFLSVCMYVCVYRGCNVTQFYGYSKEGEKQGIIYDIDWKAHAYFLSSQETGFEMSMLRKFDVELLIGNISYKQKAEIYNAFNGYNAARKMRQTKLPKSAENSMDACQMSEGSTSVSEQCG